MLFWGAEKLSQNSYSWLFKIHVDPPRSDRDLPDTDSSVLWAPFSQTFTHPSPELKPWPVIVTGLWRGAEIWSILKDEGAMSRPGAGSFLLFHACLLCPCSFLIYKGQGWLCASSDINFSEDECSLLQPPIVWVSWGASAKLGKLITRNLKAAQPIDLYLTSFVSFQGQPIWSSEYPSFCHEWCFM